MKTVLLGDVCDIEYGTRVVKSRDQGKEYFVYGGGGKTFKVDLFNREDRMIVSRFAMSVETVRYVEGKFFLNDSGLTIAPKNPNMILQRYLDYELLSLNKNMYALGRGSAQINLDVEGLKKLPLVIEQNINTQNNVVKKLDEVFAAIDKAKENTEKNLKNVQELFESEISLQFSKITHESEKKYLPDISKNLDSRRIPITKSVRKLGAIPYYGASGIVDHVDGYIFDEDILLISEDGANLLARVTPIAFSVSGKSWVNNHAHVLSFENKVTQQFVGLYLNSIDLKDFITGTAQPKLNQAKLNKISIYIPTVDLQRDVVSKLDQLSAQTQKLQKLYQQKLNNLEELRQSYLHQAFSGGM